jgi:hypothetical protein
VNGLAQVIAEMIRRHRIAEETHVRAELERLGVSPEDAPERVVLVQRQPLTLGESPLPEVWLKEDYEAQFGGAE